MENSCLVVKLSNYMKLSDSQKKLLIRIEKDARSLSAGESTEIRSHGSTDLFVVKSGWLLLMRELEDLNSAVTRVYLPGDVVGLDQICAQSSNEKIVASCPSEVCPFPQSALPEIFGKDQALSKLFFYAMGRDSLITRGVWSATILLKAHQRLAYYLLLLRTRLMDLKAVTDERFHLQMSQISIGRMISLSQHQVNRSFRELKSLGLIEFDKGHVTICDFERMKKFSQFDEDSYRISIADNMF